MGDNAHLRSSLIYVDHEVIEIPCSLSASALKRLCAIDQSATPETAGAIRTKASSLTNLPFNF